MPCRRNIFWNLYTKLESSGVTRKLIFELLTGVTMINASSPETVPLRLMEIKTSHCSLTLDGSASHSSIPPTSQWVVERTEKEKKK